MVRVVESQVGEGHVHRAVIEREGGAIGGANIALKVILPLTLPSPVPLTVGPETYVKFTPSLVIVSAMTVDLSLPLEIFSACRR